MHDKKLAVDEANFIWDICSDDVYNWLNNTFEETHTVLFRISNETMHNWRFSYYVDHGNNLQYNDVFPKEILESRHGTCLAMQGAETGVEAVAVLQRIGTPLNIILYAKNRPGFDCKFQLFMTQEELVANNQLVWDMFNLPTHYATEGLITQSVCGVGVVMKMDNILHSSVEVNLEDQQP